MLIIRFVLVPGTGHVTPVHLARHQIYADYGMRNLGIPSSRDTECWNICALDVNLNRKGKTAKLAHVVQLIKLYRRWLMMKAGLCESRAES